MKLPVFLYFLAIRFTSSGCPLPGLIFDPGSLGPIRLLSYSWFRQLLDRRRGALMGRRVLFLPGGVGAAAPIHTQWPIQHSEELKMHLHPRVTRHLRCPPGRKRKKGTFISFSRMRMQERRYQGTGLQGLPAEGTLSARESGTGRVLHPPGSGRLFEPGQSPSSPRIPGGSGGPCGSRVQSRREREA